jgi:GNAT superfamily N-acetyltransferase
VNKVYQINVRTSGEEDIDGIKSVIEASAVSEFALLPALDYESVSDEPSFDIVALEVLTEISEPEFFISLVALHRECIVGYVRCWLRSRTGGVASVSHVGVLPESQGRGVAGRMIQHLVEIATANQYFRRLELEVAEDNAAAVSVYQKAGFISQPNKVSRSTLSGERLHLLMYLDLK